MTAIGIGIGMGYGGGSGVGGSSLLFLPGSTGNYPSTPDSAAVSVTGDIDLRIDLAMDDYNAGVTENFISKFNSGAGQGSYRIMSLTGTFWIQISSNGTNNALSHGSSVKLNTVVSNGQRIKLRCTVDVDDGAGNSVTEWLYRFDDANPWLQLGVPKTVPGVISIFDGTEQVSIGIRSGIEFLAGKVYTTQIYDGIDGTLEFDADFTAEDPGTTSFTESSANAATVTINQSGSPQAEIIAA